VRLSDKLRAAETVANLTKIRRDRPAAPRQRRAAQFAQLFLSLLSHARIAATVITQAHATHRRRPELQEGLLMIAEKKIPPTQLARATRGSLRRNCSRTECQCRKLTPQAPRSLISFTPLAVTSRARTVRTQCDSNISLTVGRSGVWFQEPSIGHTFEENVHA